MMLALELNICIKSINSMLIYKTIYASLRNYYYLASKYN